MRRRLLSAGSVLLVLVLSEGVVAPQEPLERYLTPMHTPAPEFPAPGAEVSGTTWLNTLPLTVEQLHGQVVLIDFWEYTCINCIRTFAQNKQWHTRYHKYGFEIVGVHAPEFDVAYPVENVAAAVKRFGLRYPIVVDDQFQIWESYNNKSWPSRFLVDARGVIRFHRDGEGGDGAFEHAIQRLLQEAHPGLKFPSTYTIPPETNAFAPFCGVPTEEMYVGDWHGRGVLANSKGYQKGKAAEYELPAEIGDGRAALSGPWQTDKNGMIYRGKPRNGAPLADKLQMRYHAREVYAVMSVSHGPPSRIYIQQDATDLTPQNKGVDVQFDSEGHSYLEVRAPRTYYLVANPSFGSHVVTLIPTKAGLTINSFTFGNDCQTDFPHL